jgi:hypothetical protein
MEHVAFYQRAFTMWHACMHISLIEFIIAVGDEQFPIPEYKLSGMRALAFIRQ